MSAGPTLESGDIRRLAYALRITGHYQFPPDFGGGGGGSTSFIQGTQGLVNGASSGVVSGLGLEFTPAIALLSVMRPSGGLNLNAFLVSGTLDTDGFQFELDGMTDSGGYVLQYLVLVVAPTRGSMALGNGVDSGTVSGLGLLFTPSVAFLQVSRPGGDLNLGAFLNSGTLTSDGFDFELSALTDSTDYTLEYLLA